ncbi:MAG TPA: M20/M25/M40 family metallo-hydrolase, partial [Polyangiaceae bacterium]|nr:M20/M25/M40 family metallo-hydrolase [Polyangiaceae bacterium]
MTRSTDAISLLSRLISFDTHNPGGNEPALGAFLAEELRARGPDDVTLVEVPRASGARGAYVYARWGRPELLVNAHLDTVPVNAGWTMNPFEARRADGRVYGLGACDTKGAI